MPNDKYAILAARHRGFPRGFRARVERGDTNAEIAYWIRTKYGTVVTGESVRQWRVKHLNAA